MKNTLLIKNRKILFKILEYGSLFLLILILFSNSLSKIPLHYDEADWIATSSVFEAFMMANLNSPEWEESYWTLTQPPLTRYLIGFGRSVGGINVSELNEIWSWNNDFQTNLEEGRVPSDDLLWWSRVPMVTLASVSIIIGYILVKGVTGHISGVIWLILVLHNSYFFVTLGRAMGDSPLLACVALMTYFSYKLLQYIRFHDENNHIIYVYFVLLGIITGLAGSAKLNGLSTLAVGFFIIVFIIFRIKKQIWKRHQFLISSVSILVLSTTITWVALNPYLYPNPIVRTRNMLIHRIWEMNQQYEDFPESRIEGIEERISVNFNRIFRDYASLSTKHFVINLSLFIIGAVYLAIKFRNYIINQNNNHASAAILAGGTTSLPSLLTPLDWSRYYLLPVFFSTLIIAIGIGVFIKFSYNNFIKPKVQSLYFVNSKINSYH